VVDLAELEYGVVRDGCGCGLAVGGRLKGGYLAVVTEGGVAFLGGGGFGFVVGEVVILGDELVRFVCVRLKGSVFLVLLEEVGYRSVVGY
jgi:hypothetical protein